ncbi:esterase/lipase family protein [Cognatiyoonia sp. IB215182]|uniref:esterase/lipase family protein n=1 Tax=Cognatiyoonia sp. IB215182 TaxID=3097353 RepID=UPI0039B749AD
MHSNDDGSHRLSVSIASMTSAAAKSAKGRSEIILLRGLGCTASVWRPLMTHLEGRGMTCRAPTLQADYRPLVVKNPSAPAIDLAEFASEVRSLCKASRSRTGRSPVVIGHSMGGLLAQVIAAEGLCSKAIFLAPASPRAVPNRSPWMIFCFANVLLSRDTTCFQKAWRTGARITLLHRLPEPRQEVVYDTMVFEPGQLFADKAKGMDIAADAFRLPTLTVAAGPDRQAYGGVLFSVVRDHQAPNLPAIQPLADR